MDHRSSKDEGVGVDIESGLVVSKDDSHKVSTKGEDRHDNGLCNESNLSDFSVDVEKLSANKVLAGRHSLDFVGKNPLKKHKKSSSNKKAPKPPRPPRAPSLDAADLKLIREISELAMLKRARIERMKALKKMKSSKPSSSFGSGMLSMIFTVVFCIVILLQGMSPVKTSAANFEGSPVSAGKPEPGLIAVQYQHLNPSSSDSNAPAFESHKFFQQMTSPDLTVKLRRDGRLGSV